MEAISKAEKKPDVASGSSNPPAAQRQPSLQNLGLLGAYDLSDSDENDSPLREQDAVKETSIDPAPAVSPSDEDDASPPAPSFRARHTPDLPSNERMRSTNSLVAYDSGSEESESDEVEEVRLQPLKPPLPVPRLPTHLSGKYPSSPNLSPQKSSQIQIERMIRQIHSGQRAKYNMWLRRQKSFKNPKILSKCQRIFGIDQYSSSFPLHIYNPKWLKSKDSYKALDREQKLREEKARQRKKNRSKVESPSNKNTRPDPTVKKKRKRSRFDREKKPSLQQKRQRKGLVSGKFTSTVLKQLDEKRKRDAEKQEMLKRKMHGQKDNRPPSERFKDAQLKRQIERGNRES